MALSAKVYWVNTRGEFIGKYDSRTGVVTWASIYNFPEIPGTGHDLRYTVGTFGALVATADGRIGSPMGSHQPAAMAVIDDALDEAATTYWNAANTSFRPAWPQGVVTIFDPVTGRSMESGIRNYDSVSGDMDTWTAFDVDGTPHYTARFFGSWAFLGNAAFDQAYSGGCPALAGRLLYRTNNNGWIDRYDLDTGAWDVALAYGLNPGPNQGRLLAVAGSLSDGTVVYQTENTLTGAGMELWTINDPSLYIPLDSSAPALAAIGRLSDATPARSWDLETPGYSYPGGAFGDSQGIQIVDDVAYYFRQNATASFPDESIEFIAHDLVSDTKEIGFTLTGVFLNQDGTIGDPAGDYWDNVYYPGFGLVVTLVAPLHITGQIDLTRVRPYE